ncbi:hypothetical protein BJ138DRAFT_1155015 [Hygrophoropsis aurantiaca]|uniref:Uncharacterized protein n=1 Tax=Hygrophoropsis aurantiaca TaxID=72124 RepID=A0ACB8A8Z5_9AGAM|nr:hypothetical protein BJ138DRAFT_1155015 [Hygrophoropsis aurantiaca]
MLPSRSAAFICLTLVSLGAAKCKKLGTPPQPGFWDNLLGDISSADDNPRYNLYLYKGNDCARGEVLKYKRKDVDNTCVNLPKSFNDGVRSMRAGIKTPDAITIFRDADCKHQLGVRNGQFFESDLQKVKMFANQSAYHEKHPKPITVDLRQMSSYRVARLNVPPLLPMP